MPFMGYNVGCLQGIYAICRGLTSRPLGLHSDRFPELSYCTRRLRLSQLWRHKAVPKAVEYSTVIGTMSRLWRRGDDETAKQAPPPRNAGYME